MSGQGTDVTHQQAHANALQDIWNPHAALRLPKMHELPPLDTQLIPASLARAFGIQLTHGDDDTEQAGLQQERGPQAEVQQGSQQMQQLQQAQQLQLAHQLQQAGMQQGQTPYAAYPFGMEAMDRQAFAQQHAGYPTKQGFNPVLVGSMPPGNAAYGAYMQPGMFDPRDAMAAGYGLGQFQGAHACCPGSMLKCCRCLYRHLLCDASRQLPAALAAAAAGATPAPAAAAAGCAAAAAAAEAAAVHDSGLAGAGQWRCGSCAAHAAAAAAAAACSA